MKRPEAASGPNEKDVLVAYEAVASRHARRLPAIVLAVNE